MTNAVLRIALAQINPTVGDIEANAQLIIDETTRARETHNADCVVFTELGLSGYPPEDLLLRSGLYPRIENALATIESALRDTAVIIGTPLREGDDIFNSAVVLHQGQRHVYRKRELPNYGVFDEKRHFTRSEQPLVVAINGVNVGITICEDVWFSDVAKAACGAGAQVLVSLNASPFDLHNQQQRDLQVRARINENNVPVVYVNQVGGQDEVVFDGYSMIVDKSGEVVWRMPQFESAMAAVDVANDGSLSNAAGDAAPLPKELRTIYNALVCGTRDYVNKNGFAGAVIGLSGGIDSALTLAIASDALGAERVQAVMMPFDYTSQMSRDDAAQQAQTLGVEYSVIPIKSAYNSFVDALADEFAGLPRDTTEENIQARCRGVLLMAISNKKRRIVLTTGNKSEMAVGYATLYGDMAGGFAPLKDVPKTLVYRLAEFCNQQAGKEIIPQRVIDRPPSAELAPDQVDQDSLPPYDELDIILQRYIEEDWSVDDIVNDGFDRATVVRVVQMVVRNEYKRRQAPPGVRVTKRAFGRDRRYPITSGFEKNTSNH